MRWDIKFPP